MVINDFNVMGIATYPTKADPPLVVDADAVLADTVGGEFLQTIRRWDPEVSKTRGGIEHQQLTKGDSVKIRRDPPDPFASEKTLGVGVTEAPDHG